MTSGARWLRPGTRLADDDVGGRELLCECSSFGDGGAVGAVVGDDAVEDVSGFGQIVALGDDTEFVARGRTGHRSREGRGVTLTVRDRVGPHHCAEATAAAVIAAALRGGHAVTVRSDDSPTWWKFIPTVRGTTVEAVNPSLFASTDPPPWTTRLAAAADRLI